MFKKLFTLIFIFCFPINAAYKECRIDIPAEDKEFKETEESTSDKIVKYNLSIENHHIGYDDFNLSAIESITDNIIMLVDSKSLVRFKLNDDKIYEGFYLHSQHNANLVLLKFDDHTLISAANDVIKIWSIDLDKFKDNSFFREALKITATLKCPHGPIKNIKKINDKLIAVTTENGLTEIFDILKYEHVEVEGEESAEIAGEKELSEDVIKKQIIELEKQLPENKFKDKDYEVTLLLRMTEDIYVAVIDNNEESSELRSLNVAHAWNIKEKKLLYSYYSTNNIEKLFKINDNTLGYTTGLRLHVININSNEIYHHAIYRIINIHVVDDVIFVLNKDLDSYKGCCYLNCFKPVYSNAPKINTRRIKCCTIL